MNNLFDKVTNSDQDSQTDSKPEPDDARGSWRLSPRTPQTIAIISLVLIIAIANGVKNPLPVQLLLVGLSGVFFLFGLSGFLSIRQKRVISKMEYEIRGPGAVFIGWLSMILFWSGMLIVLWYSFFK